MAGRPIGTLIQKIHDQAMPCVMASPSTGPTKGASPVTPPKMPRARPRRSGGNAAFTSASASGMTRVAPAPCTARAAISQPTPGASAHAAEAAVNSPRPAANSRRRPKRSPSGRGRALDGQLPGRDRDRAPLPRSPRERALAGHFADAFENADVDRIVALLTEDAWLTMPPEPLEYQGHAAITEFFLTRGWWGVQAPRLVPTRASGQPAFGYSRRDRSSPIAHASGLIVLTLAGDRISAITHFDRSLFPLFGLPTSLGD
jgi:hypothetical protein